MKKIGMYSPYFNILGGGERYLFTIAQCLSAMYQVDIFWKNPHILKDAERKFNLNLSKVSIRPWVQSTLTRTSQLREYDVFFYMTDGSLFFSPAKKNFLIIQSSDKIPASSDFLNKLKLVSWSTLVCYSEFMVDQIQKKLAKKTTSLFVPVDLTSFKPGKKENIILSVGRFFPYLHSKKYEILIDAFKTMSKKNGSWKLHIAGSVDPGTEGYVRTLKKQATGFPIIFHEGISFVELKKLYSKATLYWHAAGFGEDPQVHPERFEHFGVSTVEAMASGCVPISYNGGGQPEIVSSESGFLWNTPEELINQTQSLISNKKMVNDYGQKALQRAQNYSVELFCSKIYEMVET